MEIADIGVPFGVSSSSCFRCWFICVSAVAFGCIFDIDHCCIFGYCIIGVVYDIHFFFFRCVVILNVL